MIHKLKGRLENLFLDEATPIDIFGGSPSGVTW